MERAVTCGAGAVAGHHEHAVRVARRRADGDLAGRGAPSPVSPSVAKYVQSARRRRRPPGTGRRRSAADVVPRPRTTVPGRRSRMTSEPSAVPAPFTLPSRRVELGVERRSLIAPPPKPLRLASLPRSVPSLKSRLRIDPSTMSSDPIVAAAYAAPLSATKSAMHAMTVLVRVRIGSCYPTGGGPVRYAQLQEAHQSADPHAGLRPFGSWRGIALSRASPHRVHPRKPLCRAKNRGRRARRRRPSDGKVGNRVAEWEKWGTVASPIDRSGGAPPTPPLRSELSWSCPLAFRGHFEHSLDAKNRLSIPARFRTAFASGTVLAKDPEPCVAVWTPETHEAIIERALGGLNPMGSEYRKLSRFYQGNSFEIELDASGRVTLPPPLLDPHRDREGGRGRGRGRPPRGVVEGALAGAAGGPRRRDRGGDGAPWPSFLT